jgi:hypothetical protein
MLNLLYFVIFSDEFIYLFFLPLPFWLAGLANERTQRKPMYALG